MTIPQKVLLFSILIIASSWIIFDLSSYLNFLFIKENIEFFQNSVIGSPKTTACLFFAVYIVLASFSLPGMTILTIASGSLFSYPIAVILVSFASSIGATFAFLMSKILFKDWVQKQFPAQAEKIKYGWERSGILYLFSLRLVPIFPFFIINIISGIMPIRVYRFYWISQLGMLPATLIYVNAGTQLSNLRNISDVMSLKFLLALTLIVALPLALRLGNVILIRKRTTLN